MLAAHAGARDPSAPCSRRAPTSPPATPPGLPRAGGGRGGRRRPRLAAGAAANVTDDVGSSAAFYAARAGSAGCLRALHEAGGDARAQFGWTPLHAASNFSQCEAVGALPAAPLPRRRPPTRLDAVARRVESRGLDGRVRVSRLPACRARAAVHEAAAATRREARLADTQGATAAHCGGARLRRRLAVATRARSGRVRAMPRPHAAARRPRHRQAVVWGSSLLMRGRGGLEAPQDW